MTAWTFRNFWYDQFAAPMRYHHYYKDSAFLPLHDMALTAEHVNSHVVWQVADDLYGDLFRKVIYDGH